MQLLGTVRQPLLTRKSNTICVLAGDAEYMSTGQIYSDENPHNCHHYKDKLFALSFDMWCPISNSVFTKVVIAKHSTCKENHFGKLNGGPKHLKHICSVWKQICDKSWSSDSAILMPLSVSWFLYLYSCDRFKTTYVYYNRTHVLLSMHMLSQIRSYRYW